jgi:hypothetical protein
MTPRICTLETKGEERGDSLRIPCPGALQPACILQKGREACDWDGEKRDPGFAGLSTSSSCLIAREQPTIKQLPIGETS